MKKRGIILGDYDTAANGWTLTSWKLSAPEQKTSYVEKAGGDGSWDLSTALTDGIPRYGNRSLTAELECSEGTRMEREALIRSMINTLDGLPWDIRVPDNDHHHLHGRVHVAKEYSDLAHAAVTVTAMVEPWKYADTETKITLTASTTARTAQLINNGRRAVVPTLTVEGSVLLGYGTGSLSLSEGTHQWADLLLTPGSHALTYSGSGKLVIAYREAVLE